MQPLLQLALKLTTCPVLGAGVLQPTPTKLAIQVVLAQCITVHAKVTARCTGTLSVISQQAAWSNGKVLHCSFSPRSCTHTTIGEYQQLSAEIHVCTQTAHKDAFGVVQTTTNMLLCLDEG
jgi:hypothetical protein